MTDNAVVFTTGDLISVYTRADALADGEQVLINATHNRLARQYYKVPVYMTRGAWEIVTTEAERRKKHGYTVDRVLGEMLYQSRFRARTVDRSTIKFRFLIGRKTVRFYDLIVQAGPIDIDNSGAAVTFMFPEEM